MTVFETVDGISARYTAQLVDETGTGISYRLLNSLTLTLTDKQSGTIINSRNAQNVLNTNDVTVSESGLLVWTLTPEDTALLTDTALEDRYAVFEWSWDADKIGKHKICLRVMKV